MLFRHNAAYKAVCGSSRQLKAHSTASEIAFLPPTESPVFRCSSPARTLAAHCSYEQCPLMGSTCSLAPTPSPYCRHFLTHHPANFTKTVCRTSLVISALSHLLLRAFAFLAPYNHAVHLLCTCYKSTICPLLFTKRLILAVSLLATDHKSPLPLCFLLTLMHYLVNAKNMINICLKQGVARFLQWLYSTFTSKVNDFVCICALKIYTVIMLCKRLQG